MIPPSGKCLPLRQADTGFIIKADKPGGSIDKPANRYFKMIPFFTEKTYLSELLLNILP